MAQLIVSVRTLTLPITVALSRFTNDRQPSAGELGIDLGDGKSPYSDMQS